MERDDKNPPTQTLEVGEGWGGQRYHPSRRTKSQRVLIPTQQVTQLKFKLKHSLMFDSFFDLFFIYSDPFFDLPFDFLLFLTSMPTKTQNLFDKNAKEIHWNEREDTGAIVKGNEPMDTDHATVSGNHDKIKQHNTHNHRNGT